VWDVDGAGIIQDAGRIPSGAVESEKDSSPGEFFLRLCRRAKINPIVPRKSDAQQGTTRWKAFGIFPAAGWITFDPDDRRRTFVRKWEECFFWFGG